jgi:UDP-glucose 4-epimerase
VTVLVTGGAGYIGAHAMRELKRAGIPCLALDNLVRGHRESLAPEDLIVGDTGDPSLVAKILVERRISAVMHFAAYAYVGESVVRPAMYYANNVGATVNLLRCMVDAGVRHFVFSSTCSTYGDPDSVPIREDHPQRPVNPYGASKLMVERVLRDFDHAYGFSHVALRYFNAAGADPEGGIGERHDPETHLVPLVLQAALGQREHVSVFGTDYATPDGTCIRDYVHVSDLASAHVLALRYLKDGGRSDSFNLGNGEGFSVREVIDMARRITGRSIKATDAPRRPGDPDRLVGNSDKARATFGWKPKHPSLSSIIQTAWDWHRHAARER